MLLINALALLLKIPNIVAFSYYPDGHEGTESKFFQRAKASIFFFFFRLIRNCVNSKEIVSFFFV